MARKKKDIEEENINADSQGDINEADDSFGLPDLDYQPVDEIEDIVEETPEPVAEEFFDTSSTETDDSYTSDSSIESDDIYAAPANEDDLSSFELADSDTDEQDDEYVPGSYTPPHNESNMAGRIVLIVLLLLLLGAAGWYFLSYKPQQDELARVEQQKIEAAEEQRRIAADEKAERERLESEQAALEQQEAEEAQEETISEEGSIETISSRTGRYYIVVGSAIDDDLAMDFAKKAIQSGTNIKIIAPFGNSKFNRITVADFDTWAEAQNEANDLKGDYGDGVWVIKY